MQVDNDEFLGQMATTQGARTSEHKKRKSGYDEKSVSYDAQEELEQRNWTLFRENKNSVRMRRPKAVDEILENRFWNVLYRFGYDELNVSSSFSVQLSRNGDGESEQISVFAKDAETVVIAKCWAASEVKKRKFQRDIRNFSEKQKSIAQSIRRHYGSGFNPKILWFFVTDKIRWSDEDMSAALENNINVVRSRELLYFEEISKKLGASARYQFHAEYLANQKVPALADRSVMAVRTKIGGHVAYFFSARPVDILRIAFVNHRDLRDPTGAPSYQRLVNPARLKEIGKFLDNKGYFPNTILLNFHRKPQFNRHSKDELSNVQFGELKLPDRYKSCWVVDGQHRLYGTCFSKKMADDAPLFFIGFDGVSRGEEAETFVTINEKQTKVPRKLLTELDGELKWESENPREMIGAIASRAVDLLNNKGAGPFENRVVTPGVSGNSDQPLTLPNFQSAILQSKLVGSVSARTKEFLPGPCWERDSEGTLMRLVDLLSWYFEKIEELATARWNAGKAGYLCSNFGVSGHVRLLGELIRYVGERERFDPVQTELLEIYNAISAYLNPVFTVMSDPNNDAFALRFKVPFGSGGTTRYFFALVEIVRREHPDFEPEGFEDYIQTVSVEGIKQADEIVRWIQTAVPKYVIDMLKKEFGSQFFEKGVPKEIQKACQAKRIDDDVESQLSVETYLDWLQIRKIIEQKSLKGMFTNTLSIRMQDERHGRTLYVGWFERMNEIRRISAHPAGRHYKEDDLAFLNFIADSLRNQLPVSYSDSSYAAVS